MFDNTVLRPLITSALLLPFAALYGASETCRTPPDPIPAILDTPPTPSVSFSPDRSSFAVLERKALPPIERLAEPSND